MPITAVVDTSIWVSAFLNPHGYPARLVAAGKGGGLVVVSSPPLMEELMEVLLRPRIMKMTSLQKPRMTRINTNFPQK